VNKRAGGKIQKRGNRECNRTRRGINGKKTKTKGEMAIHPCGHNERVKGNEPCGKKGQRKKKPRKDKGGNTNGNLHLKAQEEPGGEKKQKQGEQRGRP